MPDLPQHGITLDQLADIVDSLDRRRGTRPERFTLTERWGGPYVTSVTATATLSDGRRVTFEAEGKMLHRFGVNRDIIETPLGAPIRAITCPSEYALTMTLGPVQGWRVTIGAPEPATTDDLGETTRA